MKCTSQMLSTLQIKEYSVIGWGGGFTFFHGWDNEVVLWFWHSFFSYNISQFPTLTNFLDGIKRKWEVCNFFLLPIKIYSFCDMVLLHLWKLIWIIVSWQWMNEWKWQVFGSFAHCFISQLSTPKRHVISFFHSESLFGSMKQLVIMKPYQLNCEWII